MTNVSRTRLDSSDYTQSYKELLNAISHLNSKTAPVFIDELLTEAEKIMVVKRFAAILLFSHNFSTFRTSTAIGISLSTSQRLYQQFVEGKFDGLLQCFSKKQKSQFVSMIADFMMSKASHRARIRFFNQLNSLR